MTNMSSLLIYGINYSPELTGVGRYTTDIAEAATLNNIRVEVITTQPHYPDWKFREEFPNKFKTDWERGVLVHRVPILLLPAWVPGWRILVPLSFAFLSALLFTWRMFKLRPTTVLCVVPTLMCAPIVLIISNILKSKTILHVQDLEIDAAFSMRQIKTQVIYKIATKLEGIILEKFDKIITISDAMSKIIISKGALPENVSIIRNWIDLKPYINSQSYKEFLNASLLHDMIDVGRDKKIVLYSGSIGKKQSLETLIKAAKILISRTDIIFLICGNGPDRDRLISLAGENVKFMPLQPEAIMPTILKEASVHVIPQSPSIQDLVLPSKLAAILASGKPLVVQADPMTELSVFLGRRAAVVPTGNTEAFAEAILHEVDGGRAGSFGRRELAVILGKSDAMDRFLGEIFKISDLDKF